LKQFLTGFIILFSYMCLKYFNHFHSPFILFFDLPPSYWFPSLNTILHACLFFFKDLDFTYEREHEIFIFLILAYFAYHDDFQLHPLSCK
jgi:hypothetical protein